MTAAATRTVTGWVAYDVLDSPEGPLFAAVTSGGLCALRFDTDPDHGRDRLAERTRADVRRYPEALIEVRDQLGAYFAGERRSFDVRVDLDAISGFARDVLEACRGVGFGRTRTYGQIAADVGHPAAARAVGQALNRNPVAIVVPCHRVLGSTGTLTGYGGGLDRKARLLAREGVACPDPIANASPN